MLACRLLGRRYAFRAEGRTMLWSCERGCSASGSKQYDSPAVAARYAAAFDRRDSDDTGRRAPLLEMFPLRLFRRLRHGGRGRLRRRSRPRRCHPGTWAWTWVEMRRTRRPAAGLAAVIVVLALGGCSSKSSPAATSSGPSGATGPGPTVALQQAYVDVVKSASPSVVQIRTTAGLGSGIVLDKMGDIVTNNHVVGNSERFKVSLANSSVPRDATLIGTYPPGDIAVIRAQGAGKLHPASFAPTNPPVGAIVLAMGSPLGLSGSVSNGIVSAIGRTGTEPGEGALPQTTLPSVIQTTAAINPGNSGGALVDLDGKVVGIPSLAAIDPSQGGSPGGAAPGIGFAIPGNVAADLAGQIVRTGKVTDSRAALGVDVTGLVDDSGSPLGVGNVSVQSGGAATAAGVHAGDVIVGLDGKQTPAPSALSETLATLSVGQRVSLTLRSPGATTRQVEVTLGELAA